MAWVFLGALVISWAGFYFIMWLVDRRTWRRMRQLPLDTVWASVDVPVPVTTRPTLYDWEATGDFD